MCDDDDINPDNIIKLMCAGSCINLSSFILFQSTNTKVTAFSLFNI